MSFPRAGGCQCGAVRYELREDPLTLYVCHCTDCQKASGASYALSMIARREAIAVVQGEPIRREFTFPDGRLKVDRACRGCATSLWIEPRRHPDLSNLRPGTLDDTSWLAPVGHIWTRSAQPWVTIPDDLLLYERQVDDPLPLVRAWRSRPDAPEGAS